MSTVTQHVLPSTGLSELHPVQISISRAETYSRGLALLGVPFFLLRMLALIPVFIFLVIVGYAAEIVAFIMQFVVLFTGKYPAGPHAFITNVLRLGVRTLAWMYGLTDTYPGFKLKSDTLANTSPSPVQVNIAHADSYSRGLAFLGCILFIGRLIALIPVIVFIYIIGIAAEFTAWIMQFAVLFTGKYPEGPHTFITGYIRQSTRASAWLYGLTDKYPGFSLQP